MRIRHRVSPKRKRSRVIASTNIRERGSFILNTCQCRVMRLTQINAEEPATGFIWRQESAKSGEVQMIKETTPSETVRGDAFGICIPTPRLQGVPDVFQSFVELGAKLQSELISLWSHRAEAWLNWPFRLIACKTATDVTQAQLAFVDEMRHHYALFADGMLRDALIEQEELEEVAATERDNTGCTSKQLNAA